MSHVQPAEFARYKRIKSVSPSAGFKLFLSLSLTVGNKMSHMQPADSARHTAYMIVYGKIYTAYLDITDSWKDLA